MPGSGLEPVLVCNLASEDGIVYELRLTDEQLAAAGGLVTLNQRRVVVEGRLLRTQPPLLDATLITLSDGQSRDRGPVGHQPYLWILCRYSDYRARPRIRNGTRPRPRGGTPAWITTGARYPTT